MNTIAKVAGRGGERPLGEKLPGDFKLSDGFKLTGGIELHRLAVKDFDQLERRADEIKAEDVNSTCSINDGRVKEVRQAPFLLLPR